MVWLFGGKKTRETEVVDPDPGIIDTMPARPYRVLRADLPLYSDSGCKLKIEDSNLIILKSEDPEQKHSVEEVMPTRKKYKVGQLVQWDLNNKKVYSNSWYINPDSGDIEMAWIQAVEFIGKIVAADSAGQPQNS
jgi:hypothetical protein